MKRWLAVLLCLSVGAHAQQTNTSVVQTSVTCGTGTGGSSTLALAAQSAQQFIAVHVPANGAATVWFDYTGAGAVQQSPSIDIPVGGTQVWMVNAGYLPVKSAIYCSASSATTITVFYR